MGIRNLMIDGCCISNLTGSFSNLTGLEDLSGLTPKKTPASSVEYSDSAGNFSNLTGCFSNLTGFKNLSGLTPIRESAPAGNYNLIPAGVKTWWLIMRKHPFPLNMLEAFKTNNQTSNEQAYSYKDMTNFQCLQFFLPIFLKGVNLSAYSFFLVRVFKWFSVKAGSIILTHNGFILYTITKSQKECEAINPHTPRLLLKLPLFFQFHNGADNYSPKLRKELKPSTLNMRFSKSAFIRHGIIFAYVQSFLKNIMMINFYSEEGHMFDEADSYAVVKMFVCRLLGTSSIEEAKYLLSTPDYFGDNVYFTSKAEYDRMINQIIVNYIDVKNLSKK